MWPRTGACSARWPGSSTRRPDRLPCDASLAACGPAAAGPAQNLKGTVPFKFAGAVGAVLPARLSREGGADAGDVRDAARAHGRDQQGALVDQLADLFLVHLWSPSV